MAQPQSRWVRFKRFLKRNMTPTWAKHFSYQVFSFLVSVAMVIGVANYAITRSYDERKLTFVDGFTITAHTGAFHTNQNSLEAVQAAIDNQVEAMEIDVRQRPNGILVMAHDLVVKNSDGVPLADAVVLVATSPKSNTAHDAINAAMADVQRGNYSPIPRRLQNKHYDGADAKVKGQFYKYPHEYENHWVEQQYLPDVLKGTQYYHFGDNKTEQAARAYWERVKKRKL